MLRYVFSITALLISVTSVGFSVAREEVRCYLGLSSDNCNTTGIKSLSPTQLKPLFKQETQPEAIAPNSLPNNQSTPENPQPQTSTTAKTAGTETATPEQETNWSLTKSNQDDDKFISVEELSRMPNNKPNGHANHSVPSAEEGYVGIPIEVEPYQEP